MTLNIRKENKKTMNLTMFLKISALTMDNCSGPYSTLGSALDSRSQTYPRSSSNSWAYKEVSFAEVKKKCISPLGRVNLGIK